MTATREILDLTGDARHFNKPKWIKQNRKYPADPPAELRAYRDCHVSQVGSRLLTRNLVL